MTTFTPASAIASITGWLLSHSLATLLSQRHECRPVWATARQHQQPDNYAGDKQVPPFLLEYLTNQIKKMRKGGKKAWNSATHCVDLTSSCWRNKTASWKIYGKRGSAGQWGSDLECSLPDPFVRGKHRGRRECEDDRVEEERGAYIWSVRGRRDSHWESDSPPLHFSASASTLFSSNPQSVKTSRRPPLIMTRLSNPIAVAQTQGSALNPLVSDCFSRVKWLCPPCHSPSHQSRHPGWLGLLSRGPTRRPGLPINLKHAGRAGHGHLGEVVSKLHHYNNDWNNVITIPAMCDQCHGHGAQCWTHHILSFYGKTSDLFNGAFPLQDLPMRLASALLWPSDLCHLFRCPKQVGCNNCLQGFRPPHMNPISLSMKEILKLSPQRPQTYNSSTVFPNISFT